MQKAGVLKAGAKLIYKQNATEDEEDAYVDDDNESAIADKGNKKPPPTATIHPKPLITRRKRTRKAEDDKGEPEEAAPATKRQKRRRSTVTETPRIIVRYSTNLILIPPIANNGVSQQGVLNAAANATVSPIVAAPRARTRVPDRKEASRVHDFLNHNDQPPRTAPTFDTNLFPLPTGAPTQAAH